MLVCALAPGCGGGSGAIMSNTISSGVTDTKSNPAPGTATQTSLGCTDTTFAPNYADLMSLYRWVRLPVRVRFLDSGLVTLNDGSQVDLQQIAVEGFAEWAQATNGEAPFQLTTDPAQTDVTVHFGSLSGVPHANDVIGLERSTLTADNTVRSADVLLNTWPGMTAANVESFRETAAHEFGHTLGINGHSDSPADVMYAAHSLTVGKQLTDRDVNTLRTAYCNNFGRGEAVPAIGGTRTLVNY